MLKLYCEWDFTNELLKCEFLCLTKFYFGKSDPLFCVLPVCFYIEFWFIRGYLLDDSDENVNTFEILTSPLNLIVDIRSKSCCHVVPILNSNRVCFRQERVTREILFKTLHVVDYSRIEASNLQVNEVNVKSYYLSEFYLVKSWFKFASILNFAKIIFEENNLKSISLTGLDWNIFFSLGEVLSDCLNYG